MKRNLVGKILGRIKIFVQDFVPIRTALIGRFLDAFRFFRSIVYNVTLCAITHLVFIRSFVFSTCLDFTLIATWYITGMFVQLMTYK